MGAITQEVENMQDFGAAFDRARAADRTAVIVMRVDPHDGWTDQGHTWWEVGLPEVSSRPTVDAAREAQATGRTRQRQGL